MRYGLVAFAGLFSSVIACAASEEAASSGEDLTTDQLPVAITQGTEGVFDQLLDHNAPPGNANPTFAQHYWITKEFADSADSPVLYYICGEQDCGTWALERMADTAKVLHAAVVAVEHRYYGKSLPFEHPTLRQMQYLDVQQALDDLVAFEAFAKSDLGLHGKYISVGGSYSGMLAAYYRMKHPDLVVGAWASSAPVNVKKSFYGFDALAAKALGPSCLTLLRQSFGQAAAIFDDPAQKPALIAAIFGTDLGGWEPQKDQVLQSIGWMAQGSSRDSAGVDRFCQALEQHEGHPIDGILGLASPPLVAEPTTENPTPPRRPTPNDQGGDGFPPPPTPGVDPLDQPFRPFAWMFQVCDEMGLYQMRNPDRSLSVMPDSNEDEEAQQDGFCQRIALRTPDIAKTRALYFDPLAQATNIFWVNGTRDGWADLGFKEPASMPPKQTLFIIQRGGHHDELTNLQKDSPLPVFEAHVKFHELALAWLSE